MLHIDPKTARDWILAGSLPEEDLFVDGDLDLARQSHLESLPANFRGAWGLNLEGCKALKQLPENLDVKRLNLNECFALRSLPIGLKSYELQAQRSGLIEIPDGTIIDYKLDLSDCQSLVRLPNNLSVGSLIIKGCTALEAMPDGLSLYFLDASGCTHLKSWGARGQVEVGNINLNGCRSLRYLPDWFGKIAQLNVGGCINLERLPEHLEISSTIELANSGLQSLPAASKDVLIRWRDVQVDERIAFRPKEIAASEVLKETNIERRRVMLERIGYEEFFEEAKAEELDRDFDAGGLRTLLRVTFEDINQWQRDEPLVCLRVQCPSTARQYVIRVPPTMQSCHQAAAWVAGFDDPSEYYPDMES